MRPFRTVLAAFATEQTGARLGSSWSRTSIFIAALLLASACGDDCRETSCLPYGTYIDLNEELGTASATICFDDDCRTVLAGQGGEPDQATTGFQSNLWEEGRRLHLAITVFDSAGNVVGSISEERTMDSGACACGVLFYAWRDGDLHRLN